MKRLLNWGVVAAASFAMGCEDDDPANTDVNLDPPPADQGFHFETPAFEVAQGVEQQDCYFFQVPGTPGTPMYLHKFEVKQNVGSHHLNIFQSNNSSPDFLSLWVPHNILSSSKKQIPINIFLSVNDTFFSINTCAIR